MSIHTLQVTLGAGTATQLTTTRTPIREIVLQNNSTHTMRVGDKTTTSGIGQALASAGAANSSLKLGSTSAALIMDLEDFWVAGTAADVIDVIYVK